MFKQMLALCHVNAVEEPPGDRWCQGGYMQIPTPCDVTKGEKSFF